MESPGATADPSAHNFSQVLFVDIPHCYPPAAPVTCCYTLTAALQPNHRDWVGIFKVGWSTTKDYHTFVWAEPCPDVGGEQSMTRQVIFNDYYLPKDEIEFYQFCYVDSGGQVRGASTPFCFRKSADHSMESSHDDDLLVVTTQEQVERSVREKAELQRELDLIMEEKETLKSLLEKQQQESVSLKDKFKEKEKENIKLTEEMDQVKKQSEHLQSTVEQQQKETERLKEVLAKLTKKMETQEQKSASSSSCSGEALGQKESHVVEKYERALMKITQLEGEQAELRTTVDTQSEEIHTLKSRLREEGEELFNLKHRFQLLQIDLQSSSREKERLAEELQTLQSFKRSVDDGQQEALQSSTHDDLKTLASQLQDTEAALVAEREESNTSKRWAEQLEEELKELRKELESVVLTCGQVQQKNREQELKLRDALKEIEDKNGVIEEKESTIVLVRHEKEEFCRENENLVGVIQQLRTAYSDLQAAASADSQYTQPRPGSADGATASSQEETQQVASEQPEDLYDSMGGVTGQEEEELLMCRHCQEGFPFITRDELEVHEQSHRICPFCMLVCDDMDQSVYEDHVYSCESNC